LKPAAPFLPAWSNFYVIAGSSAAALTGLMFVVITLVRGEEQSQVRHDGIATFSTPTVMHFCAALFVSRFSARRGVRWFMSPSSSDSSDVTGSYTCRRGAAREAFNEIYCGRRRLDWYTILPLLAYGALVAGAIVLNAAPRGALFVLAGGVLSLIFHRHSQLVGCRHVSCRRRR